MLLKDLTGEQVLAAPEFEVEIAGLSADSRTVTDGFVFAALKGARTDGTRFIEAARASGAGAILVGQDTPLAVLGEDASACPVIVSDDPRRTLALMAARFYERQPEMLVAVTGTSGKTSVAVFVRQIFAHAGFEAASLGTIGTVTSRGARYGSLTTPDPVCLHQTLAQLAGDGITHAALEASSHGLDQRRLDGLELSAAAFTNLGRDHLDYHPDVEHYLAAKMRLFDTLLDAERPVVLEPAAPYAWRVAAAAREHGHRVFTVGEGGEDVRLLDIRHDGFAQILSLETGEGAREVRLPLAGRFQVSNALIAAGLAICSGVPVDDALAALEVLEGAPGRLELVGETDDDALVFVDYAHKPDALDTALAALRPFTKGRLLVVFGAGGDRDPGKRPLMGAAAHRQADIVIVTDDNPRSEDPAAIRAAILDGAPDALEIGDRRDAIEAAVGMLQPGDVLCIAGKGHEPGQIVGDDVLPFSDHEVARAALAAVAESDLFGALEDDGTGLDLDLDDALEQALAETFEPDAGDTAEDAWAELPPVDDDQGVDGTQQTAGFEVEVGRGEHPVLSDDDVLDGLFAEEAEAEAEALDDDADDGSVTDVGGAGEIVLVSEPEPEPETEPEAEGAVEHPVPEDVLSDGADDILAEDARDEEEVSRDHLVATAIAPAAPTFTAVPRVASVPLSAPGEPVEAEPGRPLWHLDEMVEATGGELRGADIPDISGMSIDSRSIAPGEAFVAIAGDRFDGHDFVGKALAAGAGLAIVARDRLAELPADGRYLVVDDPLEALRYLGRAARARSRARIVAVTGSVGKTSTKDMLKLALDPSGRTHAPVASFNNHWGVPLTLARMPADTEFGVFEIGMNHPGEITPLVQMVRPHAVIITTVEAVHLEFFGSLERIAQAKAEIFLGLEPGGLALLNSDNNQFDLLTYLAKAAGIRRIATFGRAGPADVAAERISAQTGCTSISGHVFGQKIAYKVGAPGEHLVTNSLAVLAAVAELGGDLARAGMALAAFRAPKGRGQQASLRLAEGRATLIDESYNANPASMRAALGLLRETPIERNGRRIAVIGDMLELGGAEQQLHAALRGPVAESGADLVYCAGPRMHALWELLPKHQRGAYSEEAASLQSLLIEDIRPGDVIMIKGSLGTRMGPLVEALKREFPVEDDGAE